MATWIIYSILLLQKNPVIETAEYNAEFAEEHSKKLAETMFMTDYKRQKDEEKRLEDDKKKVHGLIEGQLSNASKDQLRTIAAGVDALNNKDPLELIKQIRATHLSVAKAEPKLNFDNAMQSLNSLKIDIWGKDLGNLKGNTTDKKNKSVEITTPDYISSVVEKQDMHM